MGMASTSTTKGYREDLGSYNISELDSLSYIKDFHPDTLQKNYMQNSSQIYYSYSKGEHYFWFLEGPGMQDIRVNSV